MKLQLQRTTLSTQFIPEIDGLRFFAIATVVLFHLNTAFSREMGLSDLGMASLGGKGSMLSAGWWIIRLDLGVKVFFAISGFVLALPFIRARTAGDGKKVDLKQYFLRRLTRLEPPFIVSLVLFLLVHLFVLGASWEKMAPHFWAGLGYAHVFVFGRPNPINPVTWSLETEAQFYILAPLLFALLLWPAKNGGRFILGAILFFASVALKTFFLRHQVDQLADSVAAYLSNFITGILVAWMYVSLTPTWIRNKQSLWDAAGMLSVFAIFYFYKPQSDWLNNILFNIGIFGLMIAAFKGRAFQYFFTRKFVYLVGGMCYSIYLLHYAFFHLVVKFTGPLSAGMSYGTGICVQVLTAVPVVLLISTIFFLLIERPCMDKNWPGKVMRWVGGR